MRGLEALTEPMAAAFAKNHTGNLGLGDPVLSERAMIELLGHKDVIHMSVRLRREIRQLVPDEVSRWL